MLMRQALPTKIIQKRERLHAEIIAIVPPTDKVLTQINSVLNFEHKLVTCDVQMIPQIEVDFLKR